MARDNDVFQMLVTKGNKTALGKEKKVEELAVGQIGVFDADTNLSIDGTTPTRSFYIAVGANKNGGDTMDSINQSAGEYIQTKNIKAYSYRPHTPGKPMIVEISDFKAEKDTEYAIKINFSNQRIYAMQGSLQFIHTYVVRTACGNSCNSCNNGDCNELVKLFVEAINKDPNGLIKAEAIKAADNSVVADIDAFIKENAAVNSDDDSTNDVCLKIRLTTVPLKIKDFCAINSSYFNYRETDITVSLAQGFSCNGKVVVTQEPAYEEGSGYDVKQREYKAGGWNGRPGVYRVSETTLLPFGDFNYFADANVKYDRLAIEYQNESSGGWLDYRNDLATEIAIPTADTTTRDALIGILDKLFNPLGFDALADDATDSNTDIAVVEKTTKKGSKKDGIA